MYDRRRRAEQLRARARKYDVKVRVEGLETRKLKFPWRLIGIDYGLGPDRAYSPTNWETLLVDPPFVLLRHRKTRRLKGVLHESTQDVEACIAAGGDLRYL